MTLANRSRPQAVVVEAFVENCDAEVYLNDIPVGRIFGDGVRNPELGLSVNDYTAQGANVLELVLEPGAHPSAARTQARTRETGGMVAAARVSLYPPGLAVGESGFRELLRVSFVGDSDRRTFPYSVAGEANIPTNFPEWAWERAPVLRLDRALVEEATQYLADFRAVYLHRDLATQNALIDTYFHEGCVAFGLDPREKREAVNALLQNIWQSPTWNMERLDPDAFDFRLCARGRLLECVTKDWQAAVRSTPDAEGLRLTFPLLLGRLGDRLAWLR